MSLLLVGVGLAVALTFFVGIPIEGAQSSQANAAERQDGGGPQPVVSAQVDRSLDRDKAVRAASNNASGRQDERQGGNQGERRKPVARGPEDRTLRVTIPGMSRISDATIPYADGGNERAFKRHAGVHLRGTGNPWDREANVYIAGHRLGYPGTDSWLAFWDLNALGEGDRIFLTDTDGKRYVYRVFRDFVVKPSQVSVTRPLDGRNIVTLQTCTLPDYSQRLIVQAEKVA